MDLLPSDTFQLVVLDGLAHSDCSLGGGVDSDLSGAGLDEVSAFFHGKEGSLLDEFRILQHAGLEDDLQHDSLADLADFADLAAGLGAISVKERVQRQDDVDLVRTVLDRKLNLADLHLQKTLGSRKAACHACNMEFGGRAVVANHRSKVRVNAD